MTQAFYSLDDINNLIFEKTGCPIDEIAPDTDIDRDLGCTGDDFDELMDEYINKFNLDMTSYRWYFHTTEEGTFFSLGAFFFKPPTERVDHIPVTPVLLWKSANAGKWLVEYPEHDLPKRRYDILINQVGVLAVLVFIIYKCFR